MNEKTQKNKGKSMATKDIKKLVRIDPEIYKAIVVIAGSKSKPNYKILEEIILDWLEINNSALLDEVKQNLKIKN